MQSSNQSPSRASYGSYGEESRIDSELRHLVGDIVREEEMMKDVVVEGKNKKESNSGGGEFTPKKVNGSIDRKVAKKGKKQNSPTKLSPKAKSSKERPSTDKRNERNITKPTNAFSMKKQRQKVLEDPKKQRQNVRKINESV
ncbi:hypothetical protein Pint_28613 [Pistacia integerrima]|uniref:Uncharacterized protein n=1 Tax=Pistacia integerrima TaxID=434235 RepID=A0ACC0YSC3_9ROSI|nr:hypothetical protein Pint_28613 [Pistacia integerrima]